MIPAWVLHEENCLTKENNSKLLLLLTEKSKSEWSVLMNSFIFFMSATNTCKSVTAPQTEIDNVLCAIIINIFEK